MSSSAISAAPIVNTEPHRHWPAFLFLFGVFYFAAPLDPFFSASQGTNLHESDSTNEERAELNAESSASGHLSRQIALLTLAGYGVVCLKAPSAHRLRAQGICGVALLLFLGWSAVSFIWSDDATLTVRKLTDIPQIDFGWTLLHAADDECIAVGSVDQGFSGSAKHSEPPRHLKSAANTIHGADLPLWNS